MSTKRFRGGKWRYRVRGAGVLPRPIYLTFADEKEGDAYVKRLEALLDRGIVPDDLKPEIRRIGGLREHMRHYLAAQHVSASDRQALDVLRLRLPVELSLRDITFAWATQWVTRMKREENLSPTTVRHYVGALARCLDWVAAQGDLAINPLRLLKKGYAKYTDEDGRHATAKVDIERDRRLAGDEEARIREILAGQKPDGRQRALGLEHREALELFFELAIETAMRMREIYTLTRDQVDLGQRTIFLDRTKNGQKRQVPLTSVAMKVLRAHLKHLEGDQLFPWWKGELSDKELRRCTSQLSRQFGRIFEAAGCDDLNFHDLRHEATSRIFERTTLSELEIAKITGHRSLRSLARYANLRGSKLAHRLW